MESPKIELFDRTRENVEIYFYKTQNEEICRMLPSAITTLEQAMAAYDKAILPGSSSMGRSIYFEGQYIGDVWCYGINKSDVPNAMLSYCIFEKTLWGRGIAAAAVKMFLVCAGQRLSIRSMGAFTYADNIGSLRVLEKNGFLCRERFTEDGRESVYYELSQIIF